MVYSMASLWDSGGGDVMCSVDVPRVQWALATLGLCLKGLTLLHGSLLFLLLILLVITFLGGSSVTRLLGVTGCLL